MNVRMAVLADYANISRENKLNVMGVFSSIGAPAVPFAHRQMTLVAALEFDSSETGKKGLKIECVNDDGGIVLSITGVMDVPRSADGSPSLILQVMQLNDIVFTMYGTYEFRILLDGFTVCTVPLTVARRTQQNQMIERGHE